MKQEEQDSDQSEGAVVHVDVAPTNDRMAVPEGFHVHDMATANWVLRRITEAAAYRQHVKQWADLEIRRADREEEWFRHRFGIQLAEWARDEIANLRGRRKSIALPAGVVGFRTVAPKLVVDDEAAVLAWAHVHFPEAVV